MLKTNVGSLLSERSHSDELNWEFVATGVEESGNGAYPVSFFISASILVDTFAPNLTAMLYEI